MIFEILTTTQALRFMLSLLAMNAAKRIASATIALSVASIIMTVAVLNALSVASIRMAAVAKLILLKA